MRFSSHSSSPSPSPRTRRKPNPPPPVDVFTGGAEYPAFSHPPRLLATAKGTLLAFLRSARANLGDHAKNKIVLKRSTDQGPDVGARLQLIADDGDNALRQSHRRPRPAKTGRVLAHVSALRPRASTSTAPSPALDGPAASAAPSSPASDDDGRDPGPRPPRSPRP